MELAPTASPDDPDVQGALVRTDRGAPVSKYRLAARSAGALFVACVPAAALLHWPYQMKAGINQEKAGVISPSNSSQPHEQYPPVRELVVPPPPAWGYRKGRHWTINWASRPSMCLTVKGDKGGALLDFESCDFSYPDHQQFILPPPNSNGEIKWFKHPELCLENPRGVLLQMWECSTSQKEKRMFMVSTDGLGGAAPAQQHSRIHLAAQPSKCLDIPNGSPERRVQLWDCDDHKDNTALQPLPVGAQWIGAHRISYV